MDLDDLALWPPLGLRVAGAGLELAWATDELAFDLARQAATGVHDGAAMPFLVPWTRGTPAQVGRSVLQYGWGRRGVLSPGDWCLQLAVLRDGAVVGLQDAFARDYPVTHTAETGSWLGLAHHRQGIGWRMRLLVLHLLFDGLGAAAATTSAFADNPGSLGVTRKLGYRENGVQTMARDGAPVTSRQFRMERDDWEARPDWMRPPVELHGVAPVRELLGIA
ncbi:MAG TPA: GNAT family protein [Rugosimonospora sp.]|nr:GNAT family protein [Rugosimonospora sp.]